MAKTLPRAPSGRLSKGEQTKQFVVEKAAALFNRRGYEAASLSELMDVTGLKKGGLYRHFESKQELQLLAFEHAVEQMRARFQLEFERRQGPLEHLRGIIHVYSRIPSDPPVPGGCPILNAAVEADDGDPELRARARRVMDQLRRTIARLVREAQKEKTLAASVEPAEFADVLIANLEGGVMMSKLYGSDGPMKQVVRHLDDWLARSCLETQRKC
jgi:AcrR family transcriptional regulator